MWTGGECGEERKVGEGGAKDRQGEEGGKVKREDRDEDLIEEWKRKKALGGRGT